MILNRCNARLSIMEFQIERLYTDIDMIIKAFTHFYPFLQYPVSKLPYLNRLFKPIFIAIELPFCLGRKAVNMLPL